MEPSEVTSEKMSYRLREVKEKQEEKVRMPAMKAANPLAQGKCKRGPAHQGPLKELVKKCLYSQEGDRGGQRENQRVANKEEEKPHGKN